MLIFLWLRRYKIFNKRYFCSPWTQDIYVAPDFSISLLLLLKYSQDWGSSSYLKSFSKSFFNFCGKFLELFRMLINLKQNSEALATFFRKYFIFSLCNHPVDELMNFVWMRWTNEFSLLRRNFLNFSSVMLIIFRIMFWKFYKVYKYFLSQLIELAICKIRIFR